MRPEEPSVRREPGVSFDEVVATYPFVKDWLATHGRAQILDDKRLLSAEEKLDIFGGIEQVKKNLGGISAGILNINLAVLVVLLACRQGAMVPFEIVRFSELVGYQLEVFMVENAVGRLQRHEDEKEIGKLVPVEGITYVMPERKGSSKFRIVNRKGYLTTDEGTRALALDLSQEPHAGFLGGLLQPKPQSS